jgi:hypothetical protein
MRKVSRVCLYQASANAPTTYDLCAHTLHGGHHASITNIYTVLYLFEQSFVCLTVRVIETWLRDALLLHPVSIHSVNPLALIFIILARIAHL